MAKGYTSRDMVFNNPPYQAWPKRPIGEVVFPRFTKVTLQKPTKTELKRLKAIAKANQQDAFVVKLEGRRVYMVRSALLTEEEYHEVRSQEDQAKSDKARDRRSKLALLKDRSRSVDQVNP